MCSITEQGRVEPIIAVQGLVAGYGGATVLEDVNFEVYPGEILLILGGSGCGKSTLLKHVIGLYRPSRGRVLIEGLDVHAAAGDERMRLLRSFGVSYQSGALFGSMTLLENVRLPLEECTDLPRPLLDSVSRHKLALVGLRGFEEHAPAELSGGMAKRAAIARAMALDPRILFLDEPSAGLDPVTSAELDDLVLELARDLGMTFVIVTHELASIFAIADRVVMLDKKARGIVAQGDPRHLRDASTDPVIMDFFHRKSHFSGEKSKEPLS